MVSSEYRWTYSQHRTVRGKPGKGNRYRGRKPAAKTLALQARTARGPRTEILAKLLVAGMLVVVTMLVLGRESAWQQQWSSQMSQWWEARPWQHATSAVVVKPQPPLLPVTETSENAGISIVRTEEHVNRTPVALLSDSALFFLNAQGQVWPVEPKVVPPDLPIVTGPTVSEVPEAMGIHLRTEVDMPLLQQLLGSRLAENFSEIHLDPLLGSTLYTRDGVKILLSNGTHVARDLRRLEVVLQETQRRGQPPAQIDLRYGQHVVVRPQGPDHRR